MRLVEVPEALKLVESADDAVEAFTRLVCSRGAKRSLVVSTPTPMALLGETLSSSIDGDVILVKDNSYDEVQKVTEYLFVHSDAVVVGVGGGRAIDVAKLAAHYARRCFVSIPTQISHDGIASPIAVIKHPSRGSFSVGASPPDSVIIPMDTVLRAPRKTLLAGLGDLLAKTSALVDWKLAVRAGKEEFDDYAAMLSEASVAYFLRYLTDHDDCLADPDIESVRALIQGLLLSGVAMAVAGSSRPCSGAEHLISHAIDKIFGGRALHGEQVALGTVSSLIIQGQEKRATELASMYRRIGLPTHPSRLGLDDRDFLLVLREAPSTRPQRYTVLNDEVPSEGMVERILEVLGKVG